MKESQKRLLKNPELKVMKQLIQSKFKPCWSGGTSTSEISEALNRQVNSVRMSPSRAVQTGNQTRVVFRACALPTCMIQGQTNKRKTSV